MAAETYDAVTVEQRFFTLMPSRFPTVDVFARVAGDRSAELAEIESLTNPRLRERERLLNGTQSVDGNSPLLQNWNHAPFAYVNPEGSHFFGPEQPVLELASDIQTALAISIQRREVFLARTGEGPLGLEMRELSRIVTGRFADGRDWQLNLDVEERRRRGQAIKGAGFDGLLYHPVERPAGYCVCVLKGASLQRAMQRDHFKFVWDGGKVSKIYSFGSGAEYLPDDLRGMKQILAA